MKILLLLGTVSLELGLVLGGIRRKNHVLSFEGGLKITISQAWMEETLYQRKVTDGV